MSIQSIADFNIEFKGSLRFLRVLREEYKSDSLDADFVITIPDEYEGDLSGEQCELKKVWILRELAERLPAYNTFLLHSACFDIDGVGVAFAAHSGTGKTTHMNLWQKLLGDKMVVVNGDKPIVRFFDNEPETPYAYGTPWNGKESLGCNMRTKIKHICFIERSETNFVEKIDMVNAIERIMKQVYMPQNPIAVMKTMELIDRLLSCCNLWTIHCNMEDEAAEVAYNAIFGE